MRFARGKWGGGDGAARLPADLFRSGPRAFEVPSLGSFQVGASNLKFQAPISAQVSQTYRKGVSHRKGSTLPEFRAQSSPTLAPNLGRAPPKPSPFRPNPLAYPKAPGAFSGSPNPSIRAETWL